MPSEENDCRSNRLQAFKNKGKNADEMRRRRNEVSVELRKARKDAQLLKRRNLNFAESVSPLQENNSQSVSSMSVDEILQGMSSTDEATVVAATQAARKILSRERNPPIDMMIQGGVVPKCVEFLTHFHNPSLQFEASWALTNIASGTAEQTNSLIKAGAVPKLVQLLASPHMHVAEQAVWALGNIAGDGPVPRDMVLSLGGVAALLELVKPDINVSFLRNIVWSLSNFCRNKNPPPAFETLKPALPTLGKLLHHTDNDVLGDTCWALSYLTDGNDDKIQAVIDTGVVPRLVELLSSKETTVLTPALRAVGNIVTGNDAQTDTVISAGGLLQLNALLHHERMNIVKEATWTVSNIIAGNVHQIEAVVQAGLLPPLINILRDGDFKSQKEAAWAVTNFTTGSNIHQLAILIQSGALEPFCNLLDARDYKTVLVVLDGIGNILQAAVKMGEVNRVAIMIEECGGLDKIENLQKHENQKVYKKASTLIDDYFSEVDSEDVNLPVPEIVNGQLEFDINGTTPEGGFSF